MSRNSQSKSKAAMVFIFVIIIAALVIGYVVKIHRENTAILKADDVAQMDSNESKTKKKIVVQVDGAVNKPGVYNLSGDIRGIDAVNAAGGLRQDADTTALNLASKVQDGAKITVPVKGEQQTAQNTSGTASGQSGTQININTASKEELMQLSGIGEVLAQNIIDYRTKNGSFTSVEQIKEVNRIGDKIFEQIKDQIVV